MLKQKINLYKWKNKYVDNKSNKNKRVNVIDVRNK